MKVIKKSSLLIVLKHLGVLVQALLHFLIKESFN